MKVALIVGIVVLLSLVVLEIALRLLFGFGKPPLYVADPQMGYRLAPNQRTRRFGNQFEINQYSMRGTPISPKTEAQTLRVLLLGDSIANGGWWTDQSQIVSLQIQQRLAQASPTDYAEVEVLNASANSWGPRNELAYLAKFGTFDARVVVLLINTDDLFATAPTSVQVGRDRNYPKRYPPLALAELAGRLWKSPRIPELEALQQEGGDRVGANLEAIRQMQNLTQPADCLVIVAMTPLLREVVPPGPRDYELEARQRVYQFMEDQRIPYFDFLPEFQASLDANALYRDHIHLSHQGYSLISQRISDVIQQTLQHPNSPKAALPDSLLDDPW